MLCDGESVHFYFPIFGVFVVPLRVQSIWANFLEIVPLFPAPLTVRNKQILEIALSSLIKISLLYADSQVKCNSDSLQVELERVR